MDFVKYCIEKFDNRSYGVGLPPLVDSVSFLENDIDDVLSADEDEDENEKEEAMMTDVAVKVDETEQLIPTALTISFPAELSAATCTADDSAMVILSDSEAEEEEEQEEKEKENAVISTSATLSVVAVPDDAAVVAAAAADAQWLRRKAWERSIYEDACRKREKAGGGRIKLLIELRSKVITR